MKLQIQSKPLSGRGRILCLLNILMIILMFAAGLYFYWILPQEVPTHFDISGNPDAYGNKLELLLLPFAFSLVPLVVLLFVRFRFTLINRFPYLINLPAFMMRVNQLPPEEQPLWINRFFEYLLGFDLFIGIYLLILEIVILYSIRSGSIPPWFMAFVIVFPLIGLGLFFYSLHRLNMALDRRLESLLK